MLCGGGLLRTTMRATRQDKTPSKCGMWITPLPSVYCQKVMDCLRGEPRLAGTSGISAFPVHCGKFLPLANATPYAPGFYENLSKGNPPPSPLILLFLSRIFTNLILSTCRPSLSVPPYEYQGERPQAAPYNFANSMIPTLIRQYSY